MMLNSLVISKKEGMNRVSFLILWWVSSNLECLIKEVVVGTTDDAGYRGIRLVVAFAITAGITTFRVLGL